MRNLQTIPLPVLLTSAVLVVVVGCDRDARLADHNLRHPVIKTVTHYGKTLDQKATPAEVTYVLLRAMRDDFTASSKEERERALDVQFDVCAADELESRRMTSLSRDEYLYEVVYRWTPTVAHYVGDFETDWDKASKRLVTAVQRPAPGGTPDAMMTDVLMAVADPSGDPNAGVVIQITLITDKGYWRVLNVAFDSSRRSLTPSTDDGHGHSHGPVITPAPAKDHVQDGDHSETDGHAPKPSTAGKPEAAPQQPSP